MKINEKIAPVPKPPSARKLTDDEVYELRRRFSLGETKTDLANEFRITRPTAMRAIHGLGSYKDV